ncbi:Core-2/I-Branching enzyme [Oesophagostomum dentatum]|uniref:Core-2/I-Branching enzyme n=1 Tax=Oesophagostomum dentatum TaxID=61180 RepID=A0A0B1S9D5_OESDE|nr:Core-2/I-Branching enzyme [Oesophagostomum dentatum]
MCPRRSAPLSLKRTESKYKRRDFPTILYSSCDTIEKLFHFFPTLSDEERDFPIAYAMLMNKDAVQVMMLLSAIYQPQNQFYIAVDGKSDEKIWKAMRELSNCYPNIFVFRAKKIEWCSFEIIEAIFECVIYLSKSEVRWRYLQVSDVSTSRTFDILRF